MMTARVLTKTVEKRITEDWQREISSLGIYRPRHLLRRVGPLLVGICLDRDAGGDIYKPTFHVHCLGVADSTVSLTLDTQLRSEHSGGPDAVRVQWHEQKYKEAAARVVQQSLLPMKGDLQLEQVTDAYQRYMTTSKGKLQPVLLYRDMIILLAWGGDQASARKLLAECLQISNGVRDVTINRSKGGKIVTKNFQMREGGNFRHVGGRAKFEVECRGLIEGPDMIQRTVESQIVVLGVEHLPASNLLR